LITVDWACAGCVPEVRLTTQLVAPAMPVMPSTEPTTINAIVRNLGLATTLTLFYSSQRTQNRCS
jgi:hypothetical protein